MSQIQAFLVVFLVSKVRQDRLSLVVLSILIRNSCEFHQSDLSNLIRTYFLKMVSGISICLIL